MVPLLFVSLVIFSMTVALSNWRHGWLMAILCGLLQDPARKLTAGTPVIMTLSVIAVYAAILLATQGQIQSYARDFSRRFASLWSAFALLLLFLGLAAANGLVTFGIGFWKVPVFSLLIYLAPIPAVLIGYMYFEREESLYRLFRFYAAVTALLMIGSLLEYLRVDWRALGLVSQTGDYIRHLPGVQIRMISGFYRAPDIMGWHAAMLTSIAIAMVVRSGMSSRSWPWIALAAWGFFNCMISGRRKSIYFVAVFAAVFLWRYFRHLKPKQIAGAIVIALVLAFIVHDISSNEKTSAYAKGAAASQEELTSRLEGGVLETFRQFGIMGAGLGTATQGVQHLLGSEQGRGWQEGGLGKLAVELGFPGLLAALFVAAITIRTMLRIAALPDHPDSSQLARVTLFALAAANISNFIASAQAYSDPLLALMTMFFAGGLFAMVTLDERVAAAQQPLEHRLVLDTAARAVPG
jgi:hypothetical protein